MCLATVEKKFMDPTSLIQSGWKHMYSVTNPNMTRFPHYSLMGRYEVAKGEWLKADHPAFSKNVEALDGKSYEVGFHIYEEDSSLTSQQTTANTRVFYRGVTTIGRQSGERVVVAREMFVPMNENDWPPKG